MSHFRRLGVALLDRLGRAYLEITNPACAARLRAAVEGANAQRDAAVLAANECQGADFSRPLAQLAQGVEDHIAQDGLTGVRAAVFRDRGGHAPGEECPSAPLAAPVHSMSCQFLYADGDECVCGATDDQRLAPRKAER